MATRVVGRIRQQVLEQSYDITDHALDEAADDGFDIFDIETALLTGQIVKQYRKDPRGTRYEIIGVTANRERHVAVVGRFRGDRIFRIITVYDADAER
jgi:uncharacterized DUF497 family protein